MCGKEMGVGGCECVLSVVFLESFGVLVGGLSQ